MRIDVHKSVVEDLQALPDELRRAAQDALLDLLRDPVPANAAPYADIPNAYRLDAGLIVVFYLVGEDRSGGVIDILRVRANS